MTARITIPGRFLDDWQPARESWEYDIEGSYRDERPDLCATIERTLAKIDAGRRTARGGTVVDLDLDEVRFMHGEATYRWEFHGGGGSPYDCIDPDPRARDAARRLMLATARIIEGAS